VLVVRIANTPAVELYRSRGFEPLELAALVDEQMAMVSTPNYESSTRISRANWTWAGVLAASAPLLAWQATGSVNAIGALCLVAAMCFLLAATVVDIRTGHLPNRYVISAGAFGAIACISDATAASAALGTLIAAAPFLLLHLLDPSALGFGDVKFAAVAGLVVSAFDWRLAVLFTVFVLGATAAQHAVRPHSPRPFGRVLLFGASAAMIAGALISRTAGSL
jgi:leader peptidase (prepilin peptidase)/N-methyltransferase